MTTGKTNTRPDGPAAEPLALRLNDRLGLVVGRAYPATGAAPLAADMARVMLPGLSVGYTHAELASALANEREACARALTRACIRAGLRDHEIERVSEEFRRLVSRA